MKIEFENIAPARPAFFLNDGVEMLNAGTSDGASKGWETRRGGKAAESSKGAKQASRDVGKKEFFKKKQSTDDHAVLESQHKSAGELHDKAASDADQAGDKKLASFHRNMSQYHQVAALHHEDKGGESGKPVGAGPEDKAKLQQWRQAGMPKPSAKGGFQFGGKKSGGGGGGGGYGGGSRKDKIGVAQKDQKKTKSQKSSKPTGFDRWKAGKGGK